MKNTNLTCLNTNTSIVVGNIVTLPSILPINEIVDKNLIGAYVLGMNEKGNIVTSKILNIYTNKKE